jgi:5-methylthioadenosine/S-adenosylhomocysteine deaminase
MRPDPTADRASGIVLRGASVLTMDASDRAFDAADIRIVRDRIESISPAGAGARAGDSVIDCSDTLVTPGLVNTHTHACAGMFRGLTEDLPRSAWRDGYVVPNQARFETIDYLLSARASAAELLLNGVTCIADRWGGVPGLVDALDESGIRAIFGYTLTDANAPADWKTADALIERWGTAPESRVSVGIAPHAPDTCSDRLLRQCAERAGSLGCLTFLHLAQSAYEVEALGKRGYDGAVACLQANGLAGPRTVAAHCIYLTEREIADWGSHRISISHCPGSNLKIEARTLPLHRLLGKATIGIGTDWAASDNAMDMLAETRLAAMIGKHLADDPTALPVRTMLRMATIEGARCLGLDAVVGSIEIGKHADLVVFDLKPFEANPRHDLAANLLYSMSPRCVRDVMVDGRMLVRNGRLTADTEGLDKELAARRTTWSRT